MVTTDLESFVCLSYQSSIALHQCPSPAYQGQVFRGETKTWHRVVLFVLWRKTILNQLPTTSASERKLSNIKNSVSTSIWKHKVVIKNAWRWINTRALHTEEVKYYTRALKEISSGADFMNRLLPKMCMLVTTMAPKKAQPIRAEWPNLGDDYP